MAGNLWKACNVVMHHLTQNSLGGIAYCMWSVNYNNKSVMHPIRKNCKINNFINMACFVSLTGKNEAMESWPTSPVLSPVVGIPRLLGLLGSKLRSRLMAIIVLNVVIKNLADVSS